MEKEINVKLNVHVTLRGAEKNPGDVVTLDEQSARALIAEEKAVQADGEGNEAGNTDGDQNNTGTGDGNTGDPDAEEIEKQKKALDAQYNLEEGGAKPGLKETAKAAGVDFSFDANKAEIIEAVVAQGKAAQLIK